ncbi:MAG TPA: hypothetical protein DCX07_14585 [Phycisphaerales bacterium]|nr:hypothetical protein [Phycisphaerales bacterium]
MKAKLLIVLSLAVCAVVGVIVAASGEKPDGDKAATTQAASAPAAPADEPVAAPKPRPVRVLATVGDHKITSDKIDEILDMYRGRVPEDQLQQATGMILREMIAQELRKAYLKDVPMADKDLAEEKDRLLKQFMAMRGITEEQLAENAKLRKLQDEATGKDKVEAFLKSSPADWLDGTTLEASHVLIECPLYAPAAQQEAARAKLAGIAADIKSDKLKFEDAAKQFSDCPSGKSAGGSLGEFTFDSMVASFAKAAFAMKIGELSDIVQSPFGYHIIKVTKRTPGKGHTDEEKREIARKVLSSEMQTEILTKAAAANPVVIVKEEAPASQPAETPATQAAETSAASATQPAK